MIVIRLDATDAQTMLQGVESRLKDLRPVFTGPVDRYMDTVFQRQFDSQGSAFGPPWLPLAPLTLELRSQPGHGKGGILRDMDLLWASLIKSSGAGGVLLVDETSYVRGTDVPWATFQQLGWVSRSVFGRPRKVPIQIPARPPVPVATPEIINRVQKMVVDYVSKGTLS